MHGTDATTQDTRGIENCKQTEQTIQTLQNLPTLKLYQEVSPLSSPGPTRLVPLVLCCLLRFLETVWCLSAALYYLLDILSSTFFLICPSPRSDIFLFLSQTD